MLKPTPAFTTCLALLAGLCACDPVQPKPLCKVFRKDFAARYVVDGPTSAACADKVLSGEILHVQSYAPDPRKPGDTPGMALEPDTVLVALDAADGAAVAPSRADAYSFGKFTSSTAPGDDQLCHVADLPKTEIAIPAIPADPATMRVESPAVQLSYEWSQVRSLVTATNNGQYLGASLKRTDGTCVLTYKVTAISPAVPCGDGSKVTDEIDPQTMMPVVDPATGKPQMVPDPTSGNPSDAACCPSLDNSLNPDFAYGCDAKTLSCLVKQDFPALDTTNESARCAAR